LKVLHYTSTPTIFPVLSDRVENCMMQADYQKGVFAFYRYVCSQLEAVNPMVVHIYGAWDWRLCVIAFAARRHNRVVIYSPMRGLTSSNIEWNPFKRGFWRFMLCQFGALRYADVLVMQDNYEEGMLHATGLDKGYVEVLPAPESEADVVQKEFMCTLYNRTVDTHYMRFITPQEKQFVISMVQFAMMGKDNQIVMPNIQDISFRRVAFYVHDEDVKDIVKEGAEKAQISIPELTEVTDDMRYPKKYKQFGGFPDKSPFAMIKAASKIGLNNLTLRHWTELYHLFRYEDYDEDKTVQELSKHNLKRTTKKIQDRLTELFFLKPGYKIL